MYSSLVFLIPALPGMRTVMPDTMLPTFTLIENLVEAAFDHILGTTLLVFDKKFKKFKFFDYFT